MLIKINLELILNVKKPDLDLTLSQKTGKRRKCISYFRTLLNGETLKISDIWPSRSDLINLECKTVLPKVCAAVYKDLSTFNCQFEEISVPNNQPFPWNPLSLYILQPPYLELQTGIFV